MSPVLVLPVRETSAVRPAAVAAYIGIGANLGNAQDNVVRALELLGRLPHSQLSARSALFRTAPIEATGDDYINAAARLDTCLPAHSLLTALQALEQDFGRARPYRNAPRTLDLDILLYGQEIIHTPALDVPHPRLTQRAFALLPLLQIEPLLAIPGLGPARQFVAALADQRIQQL